MAMTSIAAQRWGGRAVLRGRSGWLVSLPVTAYFFDEPGTENWILPTAVAVLAGARRRRRIAAARARRPGRPTGCRGALIGAAVGIGALRRRRHRVLLAGQRLSRRLMDRGEPSLYPGPHAADRAIRHHLRSVRRTDLAGRGDHRHRRRRGLPALGPRQLPAGAVRARPARPSRPLRRARRRTLRCGPTAPAPATRVPAGGPGRPRTAGRTRVDRPAPRISGWRSRRRWRPYARLDGPLVGGQRLHLRGQLLPRPLVAGLAGSRLADQRQEAGGQP